MYNLGSESSVYVTRLDITGFPTGHERGISAPVAVKFCSMPSHTLSKHRGSPHLHGTLGHDSLFPCRHVGLHMNKVRILYSTL